MAKRIPKVQNIGYRSRITFQIKWSYYTNVTIPPESFSIRRSQENKIWFAISLLLVRKSFMLLFFLNLINSSRDRSSKNYLGIFLRSSHFIISRKLTNLDQGEKVLAYSCDEQFTSCGWSQICLSVSSVRERMLHLCS